MNLQKESSNLTALYDCVFSVFGGRKVEVAGQPFGRNK
jgi:hypothetical protein